MGQNRQGHRDYDKIMQAMSNCKECTTHGTTPSLAVANKALAAITFRFYWPISRKNVLIGQ